MTMGRVIPKFKLSMKSRKDFTALFEGKKGSARFISEMEDIIGAFLAIREDLEELPRQKVVQANARAICKSAKQLCEQIEMQSGTEKELLGQFMWVSDKAYYPGEISINGIVASLKVLVQAAQRLNQGGSRGRPGLHLDSLVRDVHNRYTVCLQKRPKLSASRSNDFAQALRICLKEIGTAPSNLLGVMRSALTEE